MDTEIRRTQLRLSGDARLRAGVRAALEHLGARHGLTKEEQRQFASAAERECIKVLASASQEQPDCVVTIEERDDSIEVTVERANASDVNAKQDSAHPGRNGSAPARLVKHFHKNPAHS